VTQEGPNNEGMQTKAYARFMVLMMSKRSPKWTASCDVPPPPRPGDRTRFELDQSDWDKFVELLDRPAQGPTGLQELFSKLSAFE
jgi:hypothetical protein